VSGRTARSYVVTGGAQGVGLAITARLAGQDDAHVVVLDSAEHARWDADTVTYLRGDAGDPSAARQAAQLAEQAGELAGWVNNAAIFRDAGLATATATQILELITANLALAVTGCHTAVNHFLTHRRSGCIVNLSSHQAQRPVRGALPYATAKAAIEGLTRAVAVDHGPDGIRTNAVALGTIATARYERLPCPAPAGRQPHGRPASPRPGRHQRRSRRHRRLPAVTARQLHQRRRPARRRRPRHPRPRPRSDLNPLQHTHRLYRQHRQAPRRITHHRGNCVHRPGSWQGWAESLAASAT
jgi:NAD(P)-dependent dehydrogenase (short-subunit alcohol dehydrogenase family)